MKFFRLLVLVLLIGVIVYGVNYYFFPKPLELVDKEGAGESVLFVDEDYVLEFLVNNVCKDDFVLKVAEEKGEELRRYQLEVTNEEGDFMEWFAYVLYEKEVFDGIDALALDKPMFSWTDGEYTVGVADSWPIPEGVRSLCGIEGIRVKRLSE